MFSEYYDELLMHIDLLANNIVLVWMPLEITGDVSLEFQAPHIHRPSFHHLSMLPSFLIGPILLMKSSLPIFCLI